MLMNEANLNFTAIVYTLNWWKSPRRTGPYFIWYNPLIYFWLEPILKLCEWYELTQQQNLKTQNPL